MGEFERRKDQVQERVQSTASLVGRITVIVTDALGSITREIGDYITDGIEMREAALEARRDESDRVRESRTPADVPRRDEPDEPRDESA